MALILTSPAFSDGARIPARYTCEGEDRSPPLAWSGAPAAALSLALICSDPDAPVGTWYHWVIFDLPAGRTELPEALDKDAALPFARQAVNDFKRTGYGGPCPPKGHGTHRYQFRLLALDVAALPMPLRCDARAVEQTAKAHILAEATLTGLYSR
jgi:Raf kinase inhibitor-like YbhB/YbcL family protein